MSGMDWDTTATLRVEAERAFEHAVHALENAQRRVGEAAGAMDRDGEPHEWKGILDALNESMTKIREVFPPLHHVNGWGQVAPLYPE